MQHGGHDQREPTAPSPLAEILDGAPVARSVDLTSSPDGKLTTNLWDCSAGRFRWTYTTDEIVHVLEGEVHVTTEDGRTQTLRTGDVAHFTKHSKAVWEVPEYVKKLAVHRHDTKAQRWMGRVRRTPAKVAALARRTTPAVVPVLTDVPLPI